ncbi:hypothetical protein FGO68_gene8752 [Halteria grandinella]|uniref:Uncharacterized protein n=1 Tax=Halteria grandinella TaxID=5974 RepID=A0A8J8N9E7_HALGN|nr:hypothetical protein FGO68_gene8752 [Halteria grandinella]
MQIYMLQRTTQTRRPTTCKHCDVIGMCKTVHCTTLFIYHTHGSIAQRGTVVTQTMQLFYICIYTRTCICVQTYFDTCTCSSNVRSVLKTPKVSDLDHHKLIRAAPNRA